MQLPTNPLESFRKRNPQLYSGAKTTNAASAAPGFSVAPCTDEVKLNKTERARLTFLREVSGNTCLKSQAVTLKLGDDCRFTPDFSYINAFGRMIFEDVKGFQRDDALVKIKTAARMFSWATFLIVKKDKAGWQVTEIKP
jgi:hypothetical protein